MKKAVLVMVMSMLVLVPTAALASPHDAAVLSHQANLARVERGLPKVRTSPALFRTARQWSWFMSTTRWLNDPGASCIGGSNVAVSAAGVRHPALRIARAFMRSPGHRANILDPVVSSVGIAVVRIRHVLWATEVFCA
jgi:hypothetical protein